MILAELDARAQRLYSDTIKSESPARIEKGTLISEYSGVNFFKEPLSNALSRKYALISPVWSVQRSRTRYFGGAGFEEKSFFNSPNDLLLIRFGLSF